MSRISISLASLLFIIALSLPSTTFAYTLKRTAYGNQIRWTHDRVPLRIDPRLEQLLGGERARSAATMATDAWRGFAGVPDLAIEKGAPPAYDPDRRGNGIYLLNDWPFEDNQLAMTLVTFEQNGNILGIDVLINGNKSFALFAEPSAALTTRYDLGAVLTHEFGHVLGLGESEDHPEATMWPQIHLGEMRQRVLSVDDEDGVISAYEAAAPKAAARNCSVALPNADGHGQVPALFLALGAAFVARNVQRRRRAA